MDLICTYIAGEREGIGRPHEDNGTQGGSQDCFIISVDNQMAADLFTREEKRICEGMAKFLNNTTMKMNIVVNKVVVERHTTDKSKQYAILVEKNPLVEKLRVELNLEVAR